MAPPEVLHRLQGGRGEEPSWADRGFIASDDWHMELYCCDVEDLSVASADPSAGRESRSGSHTSVSAAWPGSGKAQADTKDERRQLLAWVYNEEDRRPVAPTHRMARRPWLAEHFEKLPTVVARKAAQARQEAYQRSLEARIAFLRHLRDTYGNEVRAWRRSLDVDGTFAVNLTGIGRYCRQMDLKIDLSSLWKSLDKDSDGVLRLEELCVRPASELAAFQRWARAAFGSCAALWDTAEVCSARQKGDGRWASNKKMLAANFWEAVKALRWDRAADPGGRASVLSSLDVHGCGLVSRADLVWLDLWRSPDWLWASPDVGAWTELRNFMLEHYGHLSRAWRCLLDKESLNRVKWSKFEDCCEKLRWNGNVFGVWRVLDRDLLGSITMREFDEPSAELLGSFKTWAESGFGSVALAFKALDRAGVGMLALHDMRRACKSLGWEGEVSLLFDAVDAQSHALDAAQRHSGEQPTRFITVKELLFLDSWEAEKTPEERAEEDIVAVALANPSTAGVAEKTVAWQRPCGMPSGGRRISAPSRLMRTTSVPAAGTQAPGPDARPKAATADAAALRRCLGSSRPSSGGVATASRLGGRAAAREPPGRPGSGGSAGAAARALALSGVGPGSSSSVSGSVGSLGARGSPQGASASGAGGGPGSAGAADHRGRRRSSSGSNASTRDVRHRTRQGRRKAAQVVADGLAPWF